MPLGHAQVYGPIGYSSVEEEAIDVGAGPSQLDPEAVSVALGETCSRHVTTIIKRVGAELATQSPVGTSQLECLWSSQS